MLTLTLFRHAKSSWNSDANTDHDRPLNARGQRDAPRMGEVLTQRGPVVDRCLVSSARRTLETCDALMASGLFTQDQVGTYDELYLASPDTLMNVIQTDFVSQAEAPEHVLVLAHNPGLETLADTLSGFQTGAMPTAAAAQFHIDADDFAVMNTANCSLAFFVTPKSV